MANRLFNWTFTDVEKFLRKNQFKLKHVKGSHYFYIEMVTKFILLQFILFGCGFVKLRKKIFTVVLLRLQTFLLVFLASPKKF